METKIVWKRNITGETGVGQQTFINKEDAELLAKTMNELFPDYSHWVEPVLQAIAKASPTTQNQNEQLRDETDEVDCGDK